MKVSVVFDITPQEAIELMQGTSSTLHKEVTERVTKAMLDSTAAAYKEVMPAPSAADIMDPLGWWSKPK